VDVAKAIGLNEMTIVNWERYTTIPVRSYQEMESLCGLLSIDWTELSHQFRHGDTTKSDMTMDGETGEGRSPSYRPKILHLIRERRALAVVFV